VEAALRAAWRVDADFFRVAVQPPGKAGAAMTFEAIAHLLPSGITVVEMERDPVTQEGSLPRRVPTPAPLVSRLLEALAGLAAPELRRGSSGRAFVPPGIRRFHTCRHLHFRDSGTPARC
jgi:hypothetical protein